MPFKKVLTVLDYLSSPLDWRAYGSLRKPKNQQWLRARAPISWLQNTGRVRSTLLILVKIWSELDRVVY
jgi:hypothetical protein